MTVIFGIPNIGNTCFMAASLQFLMSSKELYKNLKNNNSYFENFEKNRLHVMKYFVDLYTKNSTRKDYRLGKQDDAMDFLQVIMKKNKDSFSRNKYDQVYFRNEIGSYSKNEEDYFIADLETKDLSTFLLYKMLRTDLEFPMLTNYTKLSNQIIIQINRFYKDDEREIIRKEKYLCPEFAFFIENGVQIGYKLISFIHHVGSLSSGHYTCYRKVNNEWYHCNDDIISKSDNPPFEDGYVFMYERINIGTVVPQNKNYNVQDIKDIVNNQDDIEFAENFENFPFEELSQDSNISMILSSENNKMENLYSYLLDGTLFWAETIRMERTLELHEQCSEFQKSTDLKALIANQLRT